MATEPLMLCSADQAPSWITIWAPIHSNRVLIITQTLTAIPMPCGSPETLSLCLLQKLKLGRSDNSAGPKRGGAFAELLEGELDVNDRVRVCIGFALVFVEGAGEMRTRSTWGAEDGVVC